MNVVYALESLNEIKFPSFFAAGGTPRSANVKSWRPSFIKILEDFNFKGTVLIPETKDGVWKHNYDSQIDWEQEAMEKANLITFWMPRDLKTLPCLTSNIEIGLYLKSGKILYGRPIESVKNSYIDYSYKKFCNKTPDNNMYDLAKNAIKFLEDRITACETSDKALEKLFMREERLTLNQIKDIWKRETNFSEAECLQAFGELYKAQLVRYDYQNNEFFLNKEKIIKDIIE